MSTDEKKTAALSLKRAQNVRSRIVEFETVKHKQDEDNDRKIDANDQTAMPMTPRERLWANVTYAGIMCICIVAPLYVAPNALGLIAAAIVTGMVTHLLRALSNDDTTFAFESRPGSGFARALAIILDGLTVHFMATYHHAVATCNQLNQALTLPCCRPRPNMG